MEIAFLARLREALTSTGFWDEFQTTWACLDCELMPWSAKAQELLRLQYAPVGAAALPSLASAVGLLETAMTRLTDDARAQAATLATDLRARHDCVASYVAAYRTYCWTVNSLDDLKLAPFHLLATEGKVHTHRDHVWHMTTLAKVCQADPGLLRATPFRTLDLLDPANEAEGVHWWHDLTGRGGEGMVVKPMDFITRGTRGLVQPAVKCRGREYLRIIYGPEYVLSANLA